MTDESITPKAEKRVLDGEVVSENPDSFFQADADSLASSTANKEATKTQSAQVAKSSSGWLGKLSALFSIAALGMASALWWQQPQQAAQVERVNQLQAQLLSLQSSQKQIQDAFADVQQKVQQQVAQAGEAQQGLLDLQKQVADLQVAMSASSTEGNSVLSGEQVQSIQQKLNALSAQVESFFASPDPDPTTDAPADSADNAITDKPATDKPEAAPAIPSWVSSIDWASLQAKLQQAEVDATAYFSQQQAEILQQQWQQKLTDLGAQLQTFIDQQTAKQASTIAQVESPQPAKEPATLQALSANQIQQWGVAINTQWILQGNVAQTQQQLAALEQAVSISDIENKTNLLRLLVADMTLLAQVTQTLASAPTGTDVGVQNLRTWVASLSQKLAQKPTGQSAGSHANSALSIEQNAPLTAWERLLEKLSAMFSLKKRHSDEALSETERMMMQDVLLQRASLMVDRVEWAVLSQSAERLNTSLKDFEAFVAKYYPQQLTEWQGVAAQIVPVAVVSRPALQIMGAW